MLPSKWLAMGDLRLLVCLRLLMSDMVAMIRSGLSDAMTEDSVMVEVGNSVDLGLREDCERTGRAGLYIPFTLHVVP